MSEGHETAVTANYGSGRVLERVLGLVAADGHRPERRCATTS